MKLIVAKDYAELSQRAAEILKEEIIKNPNIVLGLATGSTPVGTYKELIRFHKENGLDFSGVKTFNLDEYVGLDGKHPSSYRYFMDKELFSQINIKMENTNVPDGKTKNLEEYCKGYDRTIEDAGGIDIQILGIGTNGHIAFNEPAEELSVGTFVANLRETTIKDNSRFFNSIEEVPKSAISMGIGSIFKAKKIILLANGRNKGEAVKRLLEKNVVSTNIPVSFLLLHPDFTIIVDEEAYNK